MKTLTNLSGFKNKINLHFFALLGVVFLFVGKPVPYSNEYSYLLRLRKTYHPSYLANDITFSTPTHEYWLFDHIFGLLTFFLSIEVIGWAGRIACWAILLMVLIKLGRRWEIPAWMVSSAIFIWLCIGQSIIGDEWIFGGFEAKCAAYVFLILALDRFCDGRNMTSAILLGLCFSFHPIIGLWGIAAAIPALLVVNRDLFQAGKVTLVSAIFSVIGLVPLLIMRANSALPSTENLKFFELVKFPFHFDPYTWSRSAIVLVGLMLAFCILVHFQIKKTKSLNFLLGFITFQGVFFFFGLLFRVFDQFELMKYTPTRLFVVFIPLFFLFYLGKAFEQNLIPKPLLIVLLAPILFLSFWNRLPVRALDQAGSTFRYWNRQPDDTNDAFRWLKSNVPNGEIVIAPPWRYDFWYTSERAEVVNYYKPIIADLGEWQTRLKNLVGEESIDKGIRENDELAKFYFNLPQEKIDRLAKRYGARYFISESEYDYPVVYAKGRVKIYRLSEPR